MSVDLSRYFTNMHGSVYALRNLPEEVIAYLFARYSRSTLSLREDLRRMIEAEDLGALIGSAAGSGEPQSELGLLQDRARSFAEKYVLGYGHASVAEHGCVHLAIEDVSIIGSKLIEDCRLASYTEKSTRYVAFSPDKVYEPDAIRSDPAVHKVYTEAIAALLDAYTGWTGEFVARTRDLIKRPEKQSERAYEAAVHSTVFDILRYFLPAASYTNLGLTVNARALEAMVTKLVSQPLPEGRRLGELIKQEALQVVPTLLKYAEHNAYREETLAAVSALSAELLGSAGDPPAAMSGVCPIWTDPDADDKLVAAILYGVASLSMAELIGRVRRMEPSAKERVVDEYLRRRGKHESPGRALEAVYVTVEMVMDYGAYRDVQRHRMASQTLQAISGALGYEMPPAVAQFGYGDRYRDILDRAHDAYRILVDRGHPLEAAYVLPLATRVRALFTWNLREIAHFIELRSGRQGHPSYRRIAQQLYCAVEAAHPLVARYLRPNMKDYALTRD